MNRHAQTEWIASGIVEAPVEKVWEVLLDANPLSSTDKSNIARADGSQPYTTSTGNPGEGKITIEVDKKQHSVAVQGEWWYRGVHTVEAHERGSLLVYRIYNVAPGITWWLAQLVQGPEAARDMKKTLQDLLNTMSARLACKTMLLPD